MDDKTLLRGLKNIGLTIADRLESVGLKTLGDLKQMARPKRSIWLKAPIQTSRYRFAITCIRCRVR